MFPQLFVGGIRMTNTLRSLE